MINEGSIIDNIILECKLVRFTQALGFQIFNKGGNNNTS